MGKRIVRNECRDGLRYYTIETNRFLGIPVKWHQICKYDKDYLCFRTRKYWTAEEADAYLVGWIAQCIYDTIKK